MGCFWYMIGVAGIAQGNFGLVLFAFMMWLLTKPKKDNR